MEMKFKENCGVDPVTLGKGFTVLDGDPPYSGENINDPEHVVANRELEKMQAKYEWPDEKEPDDGPEGFLDRDVPTPYARPGRSETEDMG